MKITLEQIKDAESYFEENNLQVKCEHCGSTNYDFVEIEHVPVLNKIDEKNYLPTEGKFVSYVLTKCIDCGKTTSTICSDS